MPHEPVLRPWRVTDAPTLLRHLRGTADLATQLPSFQDTAEARAWIEERAGLWYFALAINGVAMGNVSVANVDRTHSTGRMGYWLAPAARGKGWAKRAACTVADQVLFTVTEPVFRLELGHRVDNPVCGRIALAAGFVHEGTERQKLQYGRLRVDTHTYGRLQTDPRPAHEPLALEP